MITRIFIPFIILNFLYSQAFDGLTLFTDREPLPFATRLINNDYSIINEWELDCGARSIAYLMPDSSLILPCWDRFKRFDWDSNLYVTKYG